MFARYAWPPNRLGLCGPDLGGDLAEGAAAGDEGYLRNAARGFEGAFPYLRLIADANGIRDPLDARVVDAYWLGNGLLDAVPSRQLRVSIEERFRSRLPRAEWRWLAAAAVAGHPLHAFHVLDVFPRVGLMRGGRGGADGVLETIEACRIRWGTVEHVSGDWLTVSAVPLVMRSGRLALAPARPEVITSWSRGADQGPAVGDVVSIHWSWACERLSRDAATRLHRWTARALEVANQAV
jgi:hypothetical protein